MMSLLVVGSACCYNYLSILDITALEQSGDHQKDLLKTFIFEVKIIYGVAQRSGDYSERLPLDGPISSSDLR